MCTRCGLRAKISPYALSSTTSSLGDLALDPAQCHPNYTADIRKDVAVKYISCEPPENLKELFPEEYGEDEVADFSAILSGDSRLSERLIRHKMWLKEMHHEIASVKEK